MDLQDFLTEETKEKVVILHFQEKTAGQLLTAATVLSHRPKPLSSEISSPSQEEKRSFIALELYEFLDNAQLSCLDTLYHQIGSASSWILSEEFNDSNTNSMTNRSVLKKVSLFIDTHNLKIRFVKNAMFKKSVNLLERYESILGKNPEMLVSKIQTERSLGLSCLECLSQLYGLPETLPAESDVVLELRCLESFMRLDTPAADAVNLLPKADQPSTFGSLFGVLNRCKTKMGSKTLERWLRQPLLELKEITDRQNIVELFYKQSILRNQLRDGPMKNIPDLDTVASKLRKKAAGLAELFRLYLFVKSLPVLVQILQELGKPSIEESDEMLCDNNDNDSEENPLTETLTRRYLSPLMQIMNKFQLYEQLIEHVVDFNALPEYKINAVHDVELQALVEEQNGLEQRAEKVLQDARSSYASFAEVRLEKSSQHGLFLRTTKGDDERQLRQQNSSIRILSILKNGTHFTTPVLERIAERYLAIDQEYQDKQQELVDKAVETALSYLPLIESVAVVVSEIDVLQAFATVATISPNGSYCRPVIYPRGTGIMKLQNARHPCVELMDNMHFIANDYDMVTGESNFQIITGPNMGGKSTYIRGIGSIVVLAQIGMFVPCDSAEMTIVDCILARVGAGDAVQKGVSTFMAEMLESSVILNTATKDSLIIIDELGRGTSTYDGFGIAWAISDYINREIHCFCLFATHFHEITALAHHHKGIINKRVSAHIEEGSELVMLYRLQEGPCTESFGVFVAQSAGFPKEVIREAKRKAQALEGKAHEGEQEKASKERMESGRRKLRKMREHLDDFASRNIPQTPSNELKAVLQSLFPSDMLVA